MNRRTPYDSENEHLFPIHVQAVPSPIFSVPAARRRLWYVCVPTVSHDSARNRDAAAAAIIAAPACLLDGDFGALGRGSRGGG